jgi:NADPH2:quinone reductase
VNGIRLQFFLVYELDPTERAAAIEAITDGLARGTLRHRIAAPTFALSNIAAAHEAVERGTIGNVIVSLRSLTERGA